MLFFPRNSIDTVQRVDYIGNRNPPSSCQQLLSKYHLMTYTRFPYSPTNLQLRNIYRFPTKTLQPAPRNFRSLGKASFEKTSHRTNFLLQENPFLGKYFQQMLANLHVYIQITFEEEMRTCRRSNEDSGALITNECVYLVRQR